MQPSMARNMCRQVLLSNRAVDQIARSSFRTMPRPPCDVFVNHRGIDTKRGIAGLLYDHLNRLKLRPFLDSKNMKPGDKIFEKIDMAIRNCKLGVAVFSPRYCESYFCLHELALLMESGKRVIPIFHDVKPSEIRVKKNGFCPMKEIERFSWALEEAKYTVGLTFDSSTGDWSNFLETASDAIVKNLIEVNYQERCQTPSRKFSSRRVLVPKKY